MSHVDEGLLHAYIDGELSAAETQGVAAHLAQCPACRGRLEEARALIARADELLAMAASPDRAAPPFRAGDVKPPARLWWKVPLPLTWAATVALALGIGTYLGEGLTSRGRPVVAVATDSTMPRVPAPTPAARDLVERRERRATAPRPAPTSPAPAPTQPAAPAAAPQLRAKNGRMQDRPDQEVAVQADSLAAAGRREEVRLAAKIAGSSAAEESAISIDSARRLLGTDPLVVPGLPIEAIYPGHALGYSGVVRIEQVLDRNTMIEVVTGRAAPAPLSEVTTAGRARADSLAALGPKRAMAPAAAPAPTFLRAPALLLEVRGPLSPDSLAALRRLLQPLRP
ncbi:MAG TPA: zf-HC2 domain-containing protein [Gemmatimonadales bacterium]|nr:zf-HC2 domain-containing protein [Gemmatimonadales bacterium]